MSSERPQRSRKIVNYGEDHLHWIEETQLQKALLRSLHQKYSPSKNKSYVNILNEDDDAVKDINFDSIKHNQNEVKTRQFAQLNNPKVVIESSKELLKLQLTGKQSTEDSATYKKEYRKSEYAELQSKPTRDNSQTLSEDSCELRLTRLQAKLLEEAGMLEPNEEFAHTQLNSDIESSNQKLKEEKFECGKTSNKKRYLHEKEEHLHNLSDSETSTKRVRAQRKFASNASPPQSRNNSPVKMNKQKVSHSDWSTCTKKQRREKFPSRVRAMRACSSEVDESGVVEVSGEKRKRKGLDCSHSAHKVAPVSIFEGVPNTDKFLDFLCFRNTTVKVELQDCLKRP